ncbi:uncharacterized protein V6R79_002356 [Siganus canaliculatus]
MKTCTTASLQTPPSNILAKQCELAALKYNQTVQQTFFKKRTWVTRQTWRRQKAEHVDCFRAYPLFDEVTKYKQCSVKAGRWISLFLSPTLVVSEWVYLPALVLTASLRPFAIILLGCGKRVNLRHTVGQKRARDISGGTDWTVGFAPALQEESFGYDYYFLAKA